MAEKKIVIDIDKMGNVHAETFGVVGGECLDEVQKLMEDLADGAIVEKKDDFFKSKVGATQTAQNKRQ